ncbi:MAG TPA: glycosyltransferase, partial [Bryobacteraceae bacterium]|nr:glycosyltransferase [Bryobacteraceae bacterium]
MPDYLVTVVIPTLHADTRLKECIESLKKQTRRDFEVMIVDNSGQGLVRRNRLADGACIIENKINTGFGAAINQG